MRSCTGNMNGPNLSTDNALARFDGAGGKTLQNGKTIEDNSGNVAVNGNFSYTGHKLSQQIVGFSTVAVGASVSGSTSGKGSKPLKTGDVVLGFHSRILAVGAAGNATTVSWTLRTLKISIDGGVITENYTTVEGPTEIINTEAEVTYDADIVFAAPYTVTDVDGEVLEGGMDYATLVGGSLRIVRLDYLVNRK